MSSMIPMPTNPGTAAGAGESRDAAADPTSAGGPDADPRTAFAALLSGFLGGGRRASALVRAVRSRLGAASPTAPDRDAVSDAADVARLLRTSRSGGDASPGASKGAGVTPAPDGAGDVETANDDLSLLAPELRSRLKRVIRRMRQEYGHEVEITEGFRTQARQNHLYAQGRSEPGEVVTWTRDSAHTSGYAADVIVDGSYENEKAYRRLARIAEQEGLTTLGSRDRAHLELPERLRSPSRRADRRGGAPPGPADPAPGSSTSTNVADASRVARPARVASVAEVADPARRAPIARVAGGGGAGSTPSPAAGSEPKAASPASFASSASAGSLAGRDGPTVPLPRDGSGAAGTGTSSRPSAEAGSPAAPSGQAAGSTPAGASRAGGSGTAAGLLSLGSATTGSGRSAADGDTGSSGSAGGQPGDDGGPGARGGSGGTTDAGLEALRATTAPGSSDKSEALISAAGRSGDAAGFARSVEAASSGGGATEVQQAERVQQIRSMRESSNTGRLSRVFLRMEGPEGQSTRVRVGLQGNLVEANVGLSEPGAADRLRARVDELHRTLQRRGLESETLTFRTLQAGDAGGSSNSHLRGNSDGAGRGFGGFGDGPGGREESGDERPDYQSEFERRRDGDGSDPDDLHQQEG